jgi:glycine/D-amino acid oxidase-like deaminating enzyme
MSSSSNSFDAVVLGAGVIGINSAYWLARAGKSVCVIDRQVAAGLETSFAKRRPDFGQPRRAVGQSFGSAEGSEMAA